MSWLRWLRNNPTYKLVSLFMALTLWLTFLDHRQQAEHQDPTTQPISVSEEATHTWSWQVMIPHPQGFQVVEGQSTKISLTARGPGTASQVFPYSMIALTPGSLETGWHVHHLHPSLFFLPDSFEIISYEPKEIRFRLERETP